VIDHFNVIRRIVSGMSGRARVGSRTSFIPSSFTLQSLLDHIVAHVFAPTFSLQLQSFLSYGRKYEGGSPFQRRKIATDVTNLRLLHRMLAENIQIAMIMEDDFVLPEGRRSALVPLLSGAYLLQVSIA
jgi:hypothetical protein